MSTDEYVPSEYEMRHAYWLTRMLDHHAAVDAAFDRFLARVRRDAWREAAQMIRDACDRWEVDGDDERLVNDVLDPWVSRVLNAEEDQA